DPEWFVGSVLHGVGGLVVIFGSPIVFALPTSFAGNGASARAARPRVWTTALTWLSLLSFYESILALRVSSGSSTVVGWTNPFLIMTFVLWLLIAAFHLWKRN